ncbi:unnamed protein product [Ectocarpus sp. 12 AP-2014]
MAHLLPPSPQPGSTCDFCNTSPATVVVKGRLACELHKTSEIIELGLSSLSSVPRSASSDGSSSSGTSSSSSSSSSSNRKNSGNDNDDEVMDVWQPGVAGAGAALPKALPPSASALLSPGSSTAINSSSSSSSSGSRASFAGAATAAAPPPQSSTRSANTSPRGSPASPLTVFPDGNDDVQFDGRSLSSGVWDISGAPATTRRATFGGSSSSGGDGGGSSGSKGPIHSRRRRRSLPLPSLLPAGAELVDLASEAASLGTLDGSGSNVGGPQQQQAQGPYQSGAGTARKRKRRQQEEVVLLDDAVAAAAASTAAGASAGAGASAAASGSDQAVEVLPRQGKAPARKIRRKAGRAAVTCIVCFEDNAVDRCARCPEGHAMCKTCVTSYVTETLMPQGTVFWDRIKCGGSSTCGHLFGPSVTSVLPIPIIKKIETKQMDVAHLVAGERDPTSDKWISKHSRDCPNCGVPIQRSSGCMHMTCIICRHNFWYGCDCKYPRHQQGCRKRL